MFAIIVKLYIYEMKNYPLGCVGQILFVYYIGPAQSLLRQWQNCNTKKNS